MKARLILGCAALCALAGVAVAAPAPNWISDVLAVRSFQTQVVRHPVDTSRYYLCWTENGKRYGMWFREANMSTKLRAMRPGDRSMMSSMVSGATGQSWTDSDDKVCWGKVY